MRGFLCLHQRKPTFPPPRLAMPGVARSFAPLVWIHDVRDHTKDGLPSSMDPGLRKAVVKHASREPISLHPL